MQRTISVCVGKGSVNHNSRNFKTDNVDPNRCHLNIDYCNEKIEKVYHELFDEALKKIQRQANKVGQNYQELLQENLLRRAGKTISRNHFAGR